MRPGASSRLTIAAVAAVSLLAGAALGRLLQPPPVPVARSVLIADMIATLDDMEKRSAGVVEIMDDMIGGNVSPTALEGVRDSMQEIVEGVGDVKSQITQLQR